MIRTFANNAQVAILAKYLISIDQLDAKAYLQPYGYRAKVNGVIYNFDYKLVQLAIDIYKSLGPKPEKAIRA